MARSVQDFFIMRCAPFLLGVCLVVGGLAAEPALAAEGHELTAVMGAYAPELVALRKEFSVDDKAVGFTTTTVRGVRFDRGVVDGHDVVIFQAGASLVNAAYQLQLALDSFPITRVLFAGVAGGIDPGFAVGDVVIPDRWAYHAEAAYLNDDGHGGYVAPDYMGKPDYQNFGMIFPVAVRVIREGDRQYHSVPVFPADPLLLDAARRAVPKLPAMKKAGRVIRVAVGGTGVSGTVFLDNAKYREWVFRVWQARCVDMESTAYAQVCWANQKPLLVIRGLSDLAGGQKGKNPIDENELQVSEIAVKVLHAVLDEL
jgi:adenosylhomocysteine nucleosidase